MISRIVKRSALVLCLKSVLERLSQLQDFNVEELPYQLVQLDVGHILGKAPCLETIWIEPECLQLEDLTITPK
jgi:hypothetical protein